MNVAVDSSKAEFLQKDFFLLLNELQPDAKGKWGTMNGQGMIEHFIEVFKIANGKLKIPLINHGERLEKFREFLFSEKQFRENTKNPLLGEVPAPLIHPNKETALLELRKQVDDFFELFAEDSSLTTTNPIFGELDYAANIQLLHKHALHHLRQFNLIT